MENDLELIKQLEERLGKKLKELPHARIGASLYNSYAVDENGNVTGLNLLGMEILDLSAFAIGEFKHLTHLRLDSNQLSDISPLEKLTQLKRLDLENNRLSDISPIEKLTNLTTLTLYNNKLSDISVLKKLTQLTTLKLYDNQLTDLSALEKLTLLTRLDLENNQLTDISVLKGLKNLKKLTLMNNRLNRLPVEVARLGMEIKWEYWGEDGMFLEGNPLESPPVEVVKRGTAAILNYFQELEKAQVRLMQCKVLIVGNGEVGKTSLMKKLMAPDYRLEEGKELTTHGIRIKPWTIDCHFPDNDEFEPVNVHFWDFGGQAIYHATHQFFLTKRSLYLFVWDPRKEEEPLTFDYWLNIIKLLGKDSPVLIVMNKSDIRTKHLELIQLMEKFELCFNIVGTDRYIVPELLPPEQPVSAGDFAPGSAVLRFEFSYEFMPGGIISRFISRCHYMVMDERFWKNGVELSFEQTAAQVTGNPLARKTSLAVTGPGGIELMTLIRGKTGSWELLQHCRFVAPPLLSLLSCGTVI